MVGATVIGDEALAAKFTAAAQTMIAEKPYWLHDVGVIMQESILDAINMSGLNTWGKEDRPSHPHLADTGRTFYQTANGISVGFGKGHPAAWALELGASPHEIVATNPSGLLHFQLSDGTWFVGPAVNHPGNRPYRFMYKGAMDSLIPILMFFLSELRAIFGGL